MRPFGFRVVQADPWLGLPSHTPVHGAAGDPTQAAPPTETAQMGQGWVGTPVRTVPEFSRKSSVASPVERSRVPLTGCE